MYSNESLDKVHFVARTAIIDISACSQVTSDLQIKHYLLSIKVAMIISIISVIFVSQINV